VSPAWPDARRQHDALSAAGCARIWTDRPATDGDERGELSGLLAYLRPGDILVVWRLDRLARTVSQLLEITATLEHKRVGLRSLEEQLDSTRRDGGQLFAAFAALAGLQRHQGAERARVNGRRGGRPAALTADAHGTIRAMYDASEHTIDQIAAAHGVSRPTIYRSLQRTRRM
jgi:DNA invertase Pin-like site-specific DNA recombinase